MGYRLNRLDEPVFMARPKPMRTEFGNGSRLESCARHASAFVCNERYLAIYEKCFVGLRKMMYDL